MDVAAETERHYYWCRSRYRLVLTVIVAPTAIQTSTRNHRHVLKNTKTKPVKNRPVEVWYTSILLLSPRRESLIYNSSSTAVTTRYILHEVIIYCCDHRLHSGDTCCCTTASTPPPHISSTRDRGITRNLQSEFRRNIPYHRGAEAGVFEYVKYSSLRRIHCS